MTYSNIKYSSVKDKLVEIRRKRKESPKKANASYRAEILYRDFRKLMDYSDEEIKLLSLPKIKLEFGNYKDELKTELSQKILQIIYGNEEENVKLSLNPYIWRKVRYFADKFNKRKLKEKDYEFLMNSSIKDIRKKLNNQQELEIRRRKQKRLEDKLK